MRQRKTTALTLAGLVVALAIIVMTASNRTSSAQQMGDMPYDLHFIDMTIMHHQEGIEMAQLAATRAANARVKAFAEKTAVDQQRDVEELQAQRKLWYAGRPLMDQAMMESMMKSMHPGMNMDMEETRRALRAANGPAFDRLFLETMIHHHMMAIDMAKEATAKAEHTELKEFARKAVTKQQNEITEMNKLKGGGSSRTTSKSKPKPTTTMTHKHMH